ncbi:hypothetical protein RJT34_11861 [Clitoria ternatea]|uniref:Uncharacterized protein n=1 Tax=Clitoria ternatea TaxID=43366 RepID=A0AAN9PKV2_CLITE
MASHHVRNPNRIIIIHRIFHNPLLNARSFSSDASLPQPHPPHPSSLKDNELAKFASIADTWWDSEGLFKPLYVMNPTRLAFIQSALCRHSKKGLIVLNPLKDTKLLM